jgi:glutaredoxin
MLEPRVRIYSLSTCVHCQELKDMLFNHNISYEFTDIDLLSREERQEFIRDISSYNPKKTFPVIIVNNKAIVGFQKDLLAEELGIR